MIPPLLTCLSAWNALWPVVDAVSTLRVLRLRYEYYNGGAIKLLLNVPSTYFAGHSREGTHRGERGDQQEAFRGNWPSHSASVEYWGASRFQDVPHEALDGHEVLLRGWEVSAGGENVFNWCLRDDTQTDRTVWLIECFCATFYCRLTTLMDYEASTMMGQSLFDYHHGGDSEYLSSAFKCCKY